MSSADGKGWSRTLLFWLLAVGGAGLWLYFLYHGDPQRAWRSMLINFLFFTSLSGGLAVWPAVVRQCNGRWHAGVEDLAAGGIAFAIPSLAALVVLWFGSGAWAPWHATEWHQGGWLDNSFLFGRNLAGLVLFWGLTFRYQLDRRTGGGRRSGGWLIVLFSLVFSLLGFDFVMALDPEWYTTLAGGYFFISSLYMALAGWGFLAVWQREATSEALHDIGQLLVAFSLMTTYLMYAHLLPMWYENLPEEVRFLVPRMNNLPWRRISQLLLAVVYFGPLVLLLTEKSKRNRWSLGLICLLVLVGMWVERWWLVAPTFEQEVRLGAVEIAGAAAGVGLFGIGMGLVRRFFRANRLKTDGD